MASSSSAERVLRGLRRRLAVDAAPAGHDQQLAARAEDVPRPLATVVSTRVFSNTASGWKTARKRRTARSYTRLSSSLIRSTMCSERVGMIAWWSVTLLSLTTRASGSSSSEVT